MNSRLALALGTTAVFAAAGAAVVLPALAHEGHGKVETQGFDIDAPRTVTPETAALIGLQTSEVDFGEVVDVLRIAGVARAQPDRVQVLAPRVGGSIVSLPARVGDRVGKGDVLVEIASPEYLTLLAEIVQLEGQISRLQVEAESSRDRSTQAEAELARVEANKESVAANVLSEKHRAAIGSRAEARLKVIDIQSAQADLDAKRILADVLDQGDGGVSSDGGVLTLRAGIDGVVTARDGVVGQGIEAGQAVLEIADHSVVQIEGELPESLVTRLEPHRAYAVRLRAGPEGEVIASGTVRYLSPIVDEVKRTARVVIDAENPTGRLREGMYVDASIVLREEKSAVVIPSSAVLTDGSVHFVFLEEKGAFVKKDIRPGIADDRVVEVLEGLAPGDVVVSRGAYSVMRIRPKPAARPPRAEASGAGSAATEAQHGSDGHTH